MRWTHTPLPAGEVEALSKRAGVSRVLAELLLRAGLHDADAAAGFLQPALAGLNDPFLLRNLEAAASRLRRAIAQREEIAVLGD
jgi:single-stranded-DNA-specific exonuclease